MAKEHPPVILSRIRDYSKQANPPTPRGVGSNRVRPTPNTNSERLRSSPTIGELGDAARQRPTNSATNYQDNLRRERQRGQDAHASRHPNVPHHGGTAGADPLFRAPPLPITSRDHNRIPAFNQERDRHKSYANVNTSSSIPALSSSTTYSPGYIAPVSAPQVPALIAAMSSVSFGDSGEQSSSSLKGWNGPPRPQVSHTRSAAPSQSIIRPIIAEKSISLDSGVQSNTSPHDRNGPSGIQDSYPRRGPPLSSNRPIVPNNSTSFDVGGFQSNSSRQGWIGPSRPPYETRHQSSHPPETQKEDLQSWQSPNRLNSQQSSLDITSRSLYYPVQPTNTHHEGMYHQTPNRSGYDTQRTELEMRRNEEETKRKEDEVKREGRQAQRREGLTRHMENSPRRFGGEERRLAQNLTLQAATRNENEIRHKDGEVGLKSETPRATQEEIRRNKDEHTRMEELHSLKDLTNEVQEKPYYPTAFGGFGDIWKCVLVKHGSGAVQVAVKTIRAFESDDEEVVRNKVKRLRRELIIWDRLKHDTILPLWGVVNNFGPYPAMVCPWADNGSLTEFLERQQDTLLPQAKFSLLNDIALGLQYLHRKSVVHGDLTGSNVLIFSDGRARLADFGLSTIMVEFVGTSYFTSSIRGNVRWVAAELFEDDEASLSPECDIYSFGSITLQILTCKVPYYYVKNDFAVLGQVIKGKKPEPPRGLQMESRHWSFMQRCWLPRAGRPSVDEIVKFIGWERRALPSQSAEWSVRN
ncbi:hypothetical protein BDR07DRAFT_1331384 [Suillus spraguei]|nr:hypothetical protein BDR07DRAFT_1331384 [Suillus spraguei]